MSKVLPLHASKVQVDIKEGLSEVRGCKAAKDIEIVAWETTILHPRPMIIGDQQAMELLWTEQPKKLCLRPGLEARG